MLKTLNAARGILGKWGIHHDGMTMVLYAMLDQGWTAARALEEYAAWRRVSPMAALLEFRGAVEQVSLGVGPLDLLTWCYREVMAGAY